ncbi:lipoprotein [Stenotrophomonas chelatiphaga]|jgi:hypothetical protein|uniref:Lipoprotein n=1 Tax=Stenotrophomonas chelatiphaga TaxID=517011 RepID=A0A0R0CQW7_9GAMM|nr:hypothetical protein [Stenotrophomonas chelatiphaga]KRG72301.1 lipoprotein [Stenotrophomonas chelatiphaga]MCS4230074.1 hypothetical protein [Stenotrophomonas chelatiphaga]ROQ45703.1 hypothetical protein EDF77_0591 [Stenotrophomonas maltophilia]
MKHLILAVACAVSLAACSDPEAERQAQQAAEAAAQAQKEAKADDVAKQYDTAVAAKDWERARMHGGSLLDIYKGTAAAARIEPGFADVKAQSDQARNLRRMQGLWQYNQIPVGTKGTQRSASIYGKERVDVDGSGPKPVQLVFRDHPQWKQHAYLVLQAGDFRCPGGCRVQVSVDGGKPRAMAAWRPDTDEAIAMFITDHAALWKLARQAQAVSIEFPVKAGGTRTVVFETGGVDASQMPWK